MKELEIILVKIFAVIGSYLIVSMPFAFGFEVSIFTTDMQELTTSIPNFTQLIEKKFSYPYIMNTQYIRVTLSNKDPSNIIKKVYLYRCKDYSPTQCIQNGILPVISVNPFNATIWFNDETKWSDVERNGVANFLILVKMDIGGKDVWAGSWDVIEQTGVGQFTERNYDMDKLNVYLKSGVQGTTVKNYIESYLNIPTNWVDHSVMTPFEGSSVNKLYELTGNQDGVDPPGTGTPEFYAGIVTGNSFNGSSKNWAFIFGGDGKISNPVAFYTAGETPLVSGAQLKIDDWSPQTVTCGSSEVIDVTSHVENTSALNCGEADCYFQDYYYTIDGVQSNPGDITCSVINPSESIYQYQCSIPVNKLPVCSAPKTSTITLYFQYKNNVLLSAEFPVTLQQPPPTLLVNSIVPSIFDCGIDTEMTVSLKVTNPPAGTPGKYYTFDGTNFNPMDCTGSGGTFVCKIPEDEICSLLQEDLDITFKFEYPEVDVISSPVNVKVTFPPPSLGIDTVTPEIFTAGEKTSAEVQLHVNYPDSISYSETDFKYKYMDKPFQTATCSLQNSFSNIEYYKCSIELDIPLEREGVETLEFRLDGYQEGQLKSLLANYFITIKTPPPQPDLTIVSTSSPLDCLKDSSLAVQAKAENIMGSPTKTEYSIDGGESFESLTCSGSGSVYTCYIPKSVLCPLLTNSLDLILKFTYDTTSIVSNSQKIYVNIPEPHMQVYSVFPDALPVGKTSQATVNLYIQYPESVSSPKFTYSYLDKADQPMSCQKVSSTSIRDYYRCSSTTFTIPSDYSDDQMVVVFAVEGTTLNYPYNMKVTREETGLEPWFEIYSTTPGKIEVEVGNSTQATLSLSLHNALENNLKHSITLQPNKWISSGTCQETDVDYDFSCDVTVNAPRNALIGENKVNITIRASDGKTYTLTNQTKVYVLPGKFYLDIQSITPDKLYCQGHAQQNPQEIKVNARLVNLQADSLLQEKITFNNDEIIHSARYCTFQGNSITCNIPTDKLLEKVTCGQGDLAPGEGLHYYPLSIALLLKKENEHIQVSGSKDVGIEAIPLQAYLEIVDEDVVEGELTQPINCLGSETIKLGDGGGYVRIRYADLLHQTPDESDLTWSFRLDAYDEGGKLTKGMGVSPTANATICKMKGYQKVGVHRYEDYQCTLFVDRKMFQRCASGEGTLALTVTSKTMGRTAEGEIKTHIIRADKDFDLYMQVEKEASDEITCWITSFDGRCHLEHSQLNTTVSIKNKGEGDIGDLKLFDSDIKFKGGETEADVYSPYCRETTKGSRKYICGFGIKPSITIKEKVTNETDQVFKDINLGKLELTTLVKYADDLAEDSLSAVVGSVTVKPKKDPAFIDYLKQKEKMKGVAKTIKGLIKGILRVAGFCVTCAAGTFVYEKTSGNDNKQTTGNDGGDKAKTKSSPYKPEDYLPETGGKIRFQTPLFETQSLEETPFYACKQAYGGKYYCNCIEDAEQCKVFFERYDKASFPSIGGCPESVPYCCCLKPPEVPGFSFDFKSLSSVSSVLNKKSPKNWWDAIGTLLIFGALFSIFVWWLSGKVKGKGTSEYTNALAQGLKWGLICIALQTLGKTLGELFKGEEGKGSKFGESLGKGMTAVGNFLYKACVFLGKNFPTLTVLLNMVMRFITFQMCIEDIERSLDQGYYGGTGGTSLQAYRSGLVGTQSALSRLQACMDQLRQISDDAWRLGRSIYYSGTGIWGSSKLTLKGSKTGNDLAGGGTLCKGEVILYTVKNWCKVIMEDGSDAQYLRIKTIEEGEKEGEEKYRDCTPVVLFPAESCPGIHSYWGAWNWGTWGSGSYTSMYQTPGYKSSRFSPLGNCGHKDDKEHVYILTDTRGSRTITYDPNC